MSITKINWLDGKVEQIPPISHFEYDSKEEAMNDLREIYKRVNIEKYPLKFESSGCLKEEFDFFTIPIINRIFKSRHVNPFVRVLDYKDKVLLTITLPRYYVSVYSKNLEIIKTLEELRS